MLHKQRTPKEADVDAKAMREHPSKARPSNPRGRPVEDQVALGRKPERRDDYRLLYEAIRDVRDNYVLHNHELYNHLTGILSVVVRPAEFEKDPE